MSTQAGTHARWWTGRTIDTLTGTRRGPQRPLEHLERLRHARDTLDTAINLMIDAARTDGATWAEIGRALGITRQAARQAGVRRQLLDQQRAEARQWRLPAPAPRRRFRWLTRRAA